MATRILDTLFGWLVFDRAFGADKLASNDGSSTGSSYSQMSPRPGVPEVVSGTDEATLQLSGAQGESIDVRVTQSGMPGRKGARVAIRGEDDVWLGWTEHQIEQFEPIDAPVLQTYVQTAVGARATTGYPVAGRMGSSDSSWAAFYWDGDDWQAGSGETADASEGLAIVGLPSGRMLAICYDGEQVAVDYSDDGGATWAPYARNALVEGTLANTTSMCTAAYSDGEISLLFERSGGSGDLYQLASDDLGVTFRTVKTHTTFGVMPTVFALPHGGFGVTYETTVGQPVYARLGSAFSQLDDAVSVDVGASTSNDAVTGWSTATGVLYMLVHASNPYLFRSFDLGDTWVDAALAWTTEWGNATTYRNTRAAWTARGACVLLQWTPPTSSGVFDDGLACLWVGGWTNRERAWDPRDPSAGASSTGGYSTFSNTPAYGGLRLITETLANSGWTKTGAGTETIGCGQVTVAGVIRLASTVGRHSDVDGTYDFIDVACSAGGAITANNQWFEVAIEESSSGDSYLFKLRIGPSGWRLVDVHNAHATLATSSGTLDMASGYQFFVGKGAIWHRPRGSRVWTRETFTATNGTYAGDYTLSYESVSASASVSIRMLGRQTTEDSIGYTAEVQTAVSGYTGLPLGSLPVAHPFSAGGHLALVEGPVTSGTEWLVDPVHDYGVVNADPEKGPSPLHEWRSGVETEQILCWELDARVRGQWLGVAVLRPRFRTAYLEYYNGSSWTTCADLDCAAGFESLEFIKSTGVAGMVQPAATVSVPGGRFIQADELVGGYLIFPSGMCRVISRNTGGVWQSTATSNMPPVRVWFEGADGTEDTSGSLTIVPPQAMVIDYAESNVITHLRLRIPAQNAPDNSIGAGVILPGFVHAAGEQPGWDWGDETALNVDRVVSPQGTPRASELGPLLRTWSWSWTEGTSLHDLRQSSDLDYLSPSAGSGVTPRSLVHHQDVWWQLKGLLSMTDSGTLPVVAVRGLPDGDDTLNDPTLMLYSYLDGSLGVTGLTGTEGVDEAVRVGTLTMREIG